MHEGWSIDRLLDPPTCVPPARWWTWWSKHCAALPCGLAAVEAGLRADRFSLVFAGGYQAAIAALMGPSADRRAICVTEAQGGHPRNIRSRYAADTGRLTGTKRFALVDADEWYVLARENKSLKLIRVQRILDGWGIKASQIEGLDEVPHGQLFLDVVVGEDAVLPGDGWTDWVKPFGACEDLLMGLALTGFFCGMSARFGMDRGFRAAAVSAVVGGVALTDAYLRAPATQVALEGWLAQVDVLHERFDWSALPTELADRWRRDRSLMALGRQRRARRYVKAWEELHG